MSYAMHFTEPSIISAKPETFDSPEVSRLNGSVDQFSSIKRTLLDSEHAYRSSISDLARLSLERKPRINFTMDTSWESLPRPRLSLNTSMGGSPSLLSGTRQGVKASTNFSGYSPLFIRLTTHQSLTWRCTHLFNHSLGLSSVNQNKYTIIRTVDKVSKFAVRLLLSPLLTVAAALGTVWHGSKTIYHLTRKGLSNEYPKALWKESRLLSVIDMMLFLGSFVLKTPLHYTFAPDSFEKSFTW